MTEPLTKREEQMAHLLLRILGMTQNLQRDDVSCAHSLQERFEEFEGLWYEGLNLLQELEIEI